MKVNLTGLDVTVGPATKLPGVAASAEHRSYVFGIPWPPSVNNYFPTFRGRRVLSKRGKEYRATVGRIVKTLGLLPFAGEVELSIEAFPPDRRRHDLDNLLKAIGDSLQHAGLFEDDVQVRKWTIERATIVKGGELRVRITG